jgi:hypothetical protein
LLRVEYLASLALLKKFYLSVTSLGQSRRLATVGGAEFSVVGGSAGLNDGSSDEGRRFRCTAGKGVKSLRHSVGYLEINDDSLVFVTKRMFRLRKHEIERSSIEDIQLKKRLLFDRLIIRTNGKQQQFYFFKDIADHGTRAYELIGR